MSTRVNSQLDCIADRIKLLRSQRNITQAELASALGLTRSSINGWEMQLAIPSTPLVIEIARYFGVSTDFLLGVDENHSISLEGLTNDEISAVTAVVECYRKHKTGAR